jgi:nucleoside-diphosphate-sugar epimerase
VFHQAALGSVPRSIDDPISTHAINATGTLNMLIAARDAGAERFVLAASSAAYGDTVELPKHEGMVAQPLSPYAASKLMGEHYCTAFSAVYNLPTVALRYFNVFGPRQRPDGPYAAVIPRFFDVLAANEVAQIYGDGGQTRDFTYISNVVDANMLALEAPPDAHGKVFNVAGGERISINDLHHEIAALCGATSVPTYTPARVGDVRDSLASLERAHQLLGYRPRVSWREGLRLTAQFLGRV